LSDNEEVKSSGVIQFHNRSLSQNSALSTKTVNYVIINTSRDVSEGPVEFSKNKSFADSPYDKTPLLNKETHEKEYTSLSAMLSILGDNKRYFILCGHDRCPVELAIDSIDQADLKKMDKLLEFLLADLSLIPHLKNLSREIGISLTKMKYLFRLMFHDSIYNYYQKARMQEAARLLINNTVSETGYALGFSNLSHFGRLFEKHFQLKPKRFKIMLIGNAKLELHVEKKGHSKDQLFFK